MKQPIFMKNTAIDEKRISFIETVITRLARRARKATTVIMPPIPISTCIMGDDVRGDVLRYMFCLDGTVDKLLILLGDKLEGNVLVEAKIVGGATGRVRLFEIAGKSETFSLAEPVRAGDRAAISIIPQSPEEKLTEVWVAFAWTPSVKSAEAMSVLIDDVEKAAGELIE